MCDFDAVGVVPGKLTFSHTLFEGKHARDIVRPSTARSFCLGNDTLDVALLSRYVPSRRKVICEGLIKVMTLAARPNGASTSQHALHT